MGPAPDTAFVLAIPLRPPSIDRGTVEIETRCAMFFFFAPNNPEEYREIALQTRWIDEHNLGRASAELAFRCYGVIEAESCSPRLS